MTNTFPLGPAAVSPGEILRDEFLIPMGLSIREVSRRMKCGPMRISEIISGKRQITVLTAMDLSKVLGTTPMFWMVLQVRHDLAKAQVIALKNGVKHSRASMGKGAKHAGKTRKPQLATMRSSKSLVLA